MPLQFESLHCTFVAARRCAAKGRGPALYAASAAVFAVQLLLGVALAAQTPATPAPGPKQSHPHAAAHARPYPHKKSVAAKASAQPAPQPAPAAPPLPNWPANKKPAEASVVWDSHGLFIQASNSSLDQILRDVSLKTGARVEGMGADERVFGIYGPGPARDVLTELLDGSGYNILMIGDQGQGSPRRIVLSSRATVPSQPSGNANPGANSENNTENDQEAQQTVEPEQPGPGEQPRPGTSEYNSAQPVPVRTPQEIFQERQQQMLQLRQQQQLQQQQQQNNPQN